MNKRIAIAVLLLAMVCMAGPISKQYLIIGVPQASQTAAKMAKIDAFVARYSTSGVSGGWVVWRVAAHTNKLWNITCIATEHLRVKLDKLNDDKVQELRGQIADANIRVMLSNDPYADLIAAGVEPIPRGEP